MRRRLGLLLLLALALLTACQGTKEPEAPLVLATVEGEGLRFYLARALREGDTNSLGAWPIPEIQDAKAWEDALWVLTKNELLRYQTDAFTQDAAPSESEARANSWTLPKSCTKGQLHLGREDVLAVCSSQTVYRLHRGRLTPVDTSELSTYLAVTFALYPGDIGDMLAVAYALAQGWRLELYDFIESETGETAIALQKEQHAEKPQTPEHFDLALDPSAPTLYVLATANPEAPALFAYTGELGPPHSPENVRFVDRVTATMGVAVAYGEGFFVVQGGQLAEVPTYTDYRAAWISPNLYLYLASEDGLSIYDVAGLPPTRLQNLSLTGIQGLTGFTLR